jgi:hypothetical protein
MKTHNIVHTPTNNPQEIQIDINKVHKLYKGLGNNCRCGCLGDYIYPTNDAGKQEIEEALERFASGDYSVTSQCDGSILEIVTKRLKEHGSNACKQTKVLTLYLYS